VVIAPPALGAKMENLFCPTPDDCVAFKKWQTMSKVQKREFCGLPQEAIKFLEGICGDCGLPCQPCRHGYVVTVSIFLEKDRGNPLAAFDAVCARSPANARACIEEEMKREDTISRVACVVYSPPD
jgi:hypothetical protein